MSSCRSHHEPSPGEWVQGSHLEWPLPAVSAPVALRRSVYSTVCSRGSNGVQNVQKMGLHSILHFGMGRSANSQKYPSSIHLHPCSRPSYWDRKLPTVQRSDDGYYVWCIIMIPNYRHQHQPRQGQLDTWVHLITPGHRHQTADWRESSFCAVHHLQSCEL